jgi:hypothetical protein
MYITDNAAPLVHKTVPLVSRKSPRHQKVRRFLAMRSPQQQCDEAIAASMSGTTNYGEPKGGLRNAGKEHAKAQLSWHCARTTTETKQNKSHRYLF